MNYYLLPVFGMAMLAGQPHEITGKMIDQETGEIILIFPEKENKKELSEILDVWGKDGSEISRSIKGDTTESNSGLAFGQKMNGATPSSISCKSDGSCDGKVSLEKTTSGY